MVVSRLLVPSLLIAVSMVPAIAQSSPAAPPTAIPFSSHSPLGGVVPPLQFSWQIATPPQTPQLGGQSDSFKFRLSQKSLGAIRQGRGIGSMQLVRPSLPRNTVVQLRGPQACYAIRSYDFTRDDPASDATRFTGSSTCQSAASVQLKAVTDPHAVMPR